MNRDYSEKQDQRLSYLEFGGIDIAQGKKNVWDFRIEQEAYDFFMLARYAKDILAIEAGLEDVANGKYGDMAHRFNENVHAQDGLATLIIWEAIHIAVEKGARHPIFLELGSTIFGCIEALELFRSIIGYGPEVRDIRFRGIEISDYLARLGQKLHSGYDIRTWTVPETIEWTSDIFYAKGVSLLYAIRSATDMRKCLEYAGVGLFDYNFSLENMQKGVLGTGKSVAYIPLNSFLEETADLPQRLYVRKSDARIDAASKRARCHFLWGEPELVQELLARIDEATLKYRSVLGEENMETLLKGYMTSAIKDYSLVDLNELREIAREGQLLWQKTSGAG